MRTVSPPTGELSPNDATPPPPVNTYQQRDSCPGLTQYKYFSPVASNKRFKQFALKAQTSVCTRKYEY
jgi:hypothetical protein